MESQVHLKGLFYGTVTGMMTQTSQLRAFRGTKPPRASALLFPEHSLRARQYLSSYNPHHTVKVGEIEELTYFTSFSQQMEMDGKDLNPGLTDSIAQALIFYRSY